MEQAVQNRLNELKAGDMITFHGNTISWTSGVYTIQRVSEAAICIDGEWVPKSQIDHVYLADRKVEIPSEDSSLSYPFETVIRKMPELWISVWFDKKTNKARPTAFGF